MMGRRQELKSGDEVDAVSQRARKFLGFRPGERKAVKRKLNKRFRKETKVIEV
jgi:hypothetical protein